MKSIIEPSRELPIMDSKDIIVVGGGPAGIAAAIRAAREGMNTLLVEHYGFLGGGHTAGMIGTFCGLYNVSKGNPVYMARGICDEIYQAMEEQKAVSGPIKFFETFLDTYDHFILKHVIDKAVTAEKNLDILFHSTVVEVIKEGNKVCGIIVENKSGRQGFFANIVIDCSGDGDVAAKAGAPYELGNKLQFPTMMFKMMNVDVERATSLTINEISERLESAKMELDLPRTQGWIMKTPRKGEILLNITKAEIYGRAVDGTKISELSIAEISGRDQVSRYAAFLKRYIPGFEEACIEDCGAQLAIRETRKIHGEYRLAPEDVTEAKHFSDGIASSSWPVEAYKENKVILKWLPDGDTYEVPYRCLVPLEVDGLLVAGRCLSATHEAHASARTWTICMEMGEAAGLAASAATRKGIKAREIDGSSLRKSLGLDEQLGRISDKTIAQIISFS